MGTGKSAVGERLARSLGWDFVDADPVVEQDMGMPVTEIFSRLGEAAFRRAEERVVLRLLREAAASARGTVVSLGGGAVTIPAVAEKLKAEPRVFLLDEDVDTAFQRACRQPRPLAAGAERFRALFAEREELYRSVAGFIIDTRGKGVEQVAGEIEDLMRGNNTEMNDGRKGTP